MLTQKVVEEKTVRDADMRALEGAVKWLRPLVEGEGWDYIVVWKLGDDPSRFIEWMDCCCGGGSGDHVNVTEENCVEKHLLPLCRDGYIKHPIRTKACEALASLPSSIPVYSGIHSEVVISTQPRWLSHAKTSNPNHSQDSIGTQVLIPVGGGLIELFSSKMVPVNHNFTDFIATQYKTNDNIYAFLDEFYNILQDVGFANHPVRTENLKLQMDEASILGGAIEYIQELQNDVNTLQDELREAPESTQIPPAAKDNPSSSTLGANKQLEVSSTVEVSQIGARSFLLKIINKHKRGGFAMLMEALKLLELQVIDANVATYNGMVSNVLTIEANGAEVQPDALLTLVTKCLHIEETDGVLQLKNAP
ncbi:unnamed protein product [Ilex paraguariensis]|uniref:BHLH transcription factor n=1 Tax=Ilex paraguariensis TaxID=185542 RepID=A0ABC8RTV1_9AQUA